MGRWFYLPPGLQSGRCVNTGLWEQQGGQHRLKAGPVGLGRLWRPQQGRARGRGTEAGSEVGAALRIQAWGRAECWADAWPREAGGKGASVDSGGSPQGWAKGQRKTGVCLFSLRRKT